MFKSKQTGGALLIIVTFIVLTAVTLLLTKLNENDFQAEDKEQTARALRQAKEALIGFAATYAKTHPGQPQGYLPCPDHDGNGSSSTCGTAGHSVIGRFPWRTLGLPPLRDGSGECLWYAVSGNYKDNPKLTLTSDSDGAFIIEDSNSNVIVGSSARNRAIAVIFAPSVVLSGQARAPDTSKECGDNVQVIDYLDSLNNINNATGDDGSGSNIFVSDTSISANFWVTSNPTDTPTFINASKTKVGGNTGQVIFNDTLIWITPTDFEPIYQRMDFWVAEKVTGCLQAYVENEDYREYFLETAYDSNGGGGFLEAIGDRDDPEDGTYRSIVSDSYDEDDCSDDCEDCKEQCKDEETVCKNDCPLDSDYGDCVSDCAHQKIICRADCSSSGGGGTYTPETIDIEEKFPWAAEINQNDGSDVTFNITEGEKFGRVPNTPIVATQNGMLPTWTEDPDNDDHTSITYACNAEKPICFDENQSTASCGGVPDKDWYWWWWDEWKKMVFYGIDNDYAPDTITNFWVRGNKEDTFARITSPIGTTLEADEWRLSTLPDPHPPTPSLLLNTDPAKFLVIVAGRRLDTQNRTSIADKTNLSNYLESENATPSDDVFERSSIINTFNDVACRDESDDCEIP